MNRPKTIVNYEGPQGQALALAQSVDQLGQYLRQMGSLIGQMQRRMDELEAQQRAVTVSHADVKRLQGMIRARAAELCGKYGLGQPVRVDTRAAIRKDVLRKYGVKDLHDLPAAKLAGCERTISEWTSIRLMMEMRGRAAEAKGGGA